MTRGRGTPNSSVQQQEIEMQDAEQIAIECETSKERAIELLTIGDFDGFLRTIPPDVNRRHEDYDDKTLLEYACEVDREGKFVKKLLEKEADSNDRNISLQCSALHIAAKSRNKVALKLLLRHHSTDPNALDERGDNVLHTLCRQPEDGEEVIECVAIVLKECAELPVDETGGRNGNVRSSFIDVNHLNRDGKTPIYLAVVNKSEHVVRLLLQHKCKIDIDDRKDKNTTRVLLEEWGAIEPESLPEKEEFRRSLFFFLYFKDESGFVSSLQSEGCNQVVLDGYDGKYTLLQTAVIKRLDKAVGELLMAGADVNKTYYGEISPCELAAFNGFHEILKLLIDSQAILVRIGGLSAIHWVIRGAGKQNSLTPDYKKCFEIIMQNSKAESIANWPDESGYTPLHYAINYGISDFVIGLMEHGALLGVPDNSGNIALTGCSLTDLQKFLHRRIQVKDPLKPSKKIIFDINFLKKYDNSQNDRAAFYSSQTLFAISREKKLRPALMHPVFQCFLDVKWTIISFLYWVFMMIYLVFIVLLICFLFDEYHPSKDFRLNVNSSKDDANTDKFEFPTQGLMSSILYVCLWFTFLFFLVVDVFQYFLAWKTGSFSVAHFILKGLLAFSCFALLVLHFLRSPNWSVVMSVLSILLSSSEFVLLMRNIPKCSTYVIMLQTVTWNFLKFLLWFSPLIIAFVISFMFLFRVNSENPIPDDLGFWAFKIFVMTTGEFEAEDMMKSATIPIVSHLVFLMFVFYIAIVLFNLLNALAICDSKIINEDAELLAIISKIELLHHMEITLAVLRKCRCGIISQFLTKYETSLSFQNCVTSGKLSVEVNGHNTLITNSRSKKIRIQGHIIKSAEDIVKRENFDSGDILRDWTQFKEKLENILSSFVKGTQCPPED